MLSVDTVSLQMEVVYSITRVKHTTRIYIRAAETDAVTMMIALHCSRVHVATRKNVIPFIECLVMGTRNAV